ncbi:hypothetical protein M378DRAFT_170485 [Amanita muscaria Koide BX008]|uniref:Uncharacterized protein n=1 Tax=Amanita muscaria (strain Koide BX008) TaxID=946122 RepID=A0A0C2WQP4_AMAMK|nr:hypothetical protein M378DRAFT_170485 [Amanita muscaria Koide BX008]
MRASFWCWMCDMEGGSFVACLDYRIAGWSRWYNVHVLPDGDSTWKGPGNVKSSVRTTVA